MTDHRSATPLLLMAALLAGAVLAHAQTTPPPAEPPISRLAARIAELLRKAHAKKVVVAELQGPEGQAHPVGKYLADRVSESLQKEFPDLEVIDRWQHEPNGNDNGDYEEKGTALEKARAWARKLGADAV